MQSLFLLADLYLLADSQQRPASAVHIAFEAKVLQSIAHGKNLSDAPARLDDCAKAHIYEAIAGTFVFDAAWIGAHTAAKANSGDRNGTVNGCCVRCLFLVWPRQFPKLKVCFCRLSSLTIAHYCHPVK